MATFVDDAYWDVFVYPEKDLKKLADENVGWKSGELRAYVFPRRRGFERFRRIGEKGREHCAGCDRARCRE